MVSPKQVAQAIGVSESSLKRWCDRGMLSTVRTAGGHRRLAVEDVVQFLRKSGRALVRPELLGLPATVGQGETVVSRAREQLRAALVAGDEAACRRIVADLYLSGQSACDICDRVMTGAFHEIGDLWQCGEVEVYRERRAVEIALKTLYDLRQAMPEPALDAPLAIGGALEHDPYRLPTTMAEVALREIGWRAMSCGTMLPAATLEQAVRQNRPTLVWVSVSAFQSVQQLISDCRQLFEAAVECGAALVVGGRALTEEVRSHLDYSAYCDLLRHLVSFCETLTPANRGRKSEA